jgi:hypothetical protein
MTRAYFEKDGSHYTVDIREHASDAESCAGISAIVYALVGYLHNNDDVQTIRERVQPGDFRVEFVGEENAEAVFYMTYIGIAQIGETKKTVETDLQIIL